MGGGTAFKCAAGTLRYDVRFVKEGWGLPYGISYLPGFRPRLLQPLSTVRDGLDALTDAASGESPPVEETSTEASALPRRSGQPRLESPAAPQQKADQVTRTNRPARSSGNV